MTDDVDHPRGQPDPVGRAALDRPAVLRLLSEMLTEAWSSFERPRPAEPQLPEDLAQRLLAGLPQETGDPAAALADAAHVLDASHSPARPLFLAYVGSSGLEAGVLGAALTTAYDINMAVNAGAVEALEAQTLAWVAELLGYPATEGVFTSGGMISNLTALVAARERAVPGARRHGLRGAVAVYCSAEAHHSIVRAAEVAGLGSDAIRSIELDDARRMRPDALAAALARDVAGGATPVAVVATAGTTLTGAVDPIDAIADVCAAHGVWLHVDGAYGLPAAAAPSTAALFAGVERADSVTVDAHKWLGVPKSCSLLLLREAGALSATFHHDEQYMVHHDGRVNAVDSTLEYSRPARSVPLWLALRTYGADAYRAWIEQTLDLARRLTAEIRRDPAFELLHEPALTAICFRHRPDDRETDVDRHNIRLAEVLIDDGRVHLAGAVIDGRACLRVCFVNFRTRPQDVDTVLAVVREVATDLTAGRV